MSDTAHDSEQPPVAPPARKMSATERFRSLLRRRQRQDSAIPFSPPTSSGGLDSLTEGSETTAFEARSPALSDRSMNRDSVFSEGSSLMLYSPLQPSQELAVEVAVSEWREWRPESFEDLFDFENDRRERDLSNPSNPSNPQDSNDAPESNEEQETRRVRVWIPSRTHLSFQFLWWGYRIYMPPPVLDVLNNQRMEHAKRAAILATALQWVLNHIPVSTIPLPLLPLTTLLSGLPYITGQIGTLLAWSWSAIQSFDEGNGVILTATWVLPVVLLPSTWRIQAPAPPPLEPPATVAEVEAETRSDRSSSGSHYTTASEAGSVSTNLPKAS